MKMRWDCLWMHFKVICSSRRIRFEVAELVSSSVLSIFSNASQTIPQLFRGAKIVSSLVYNVRWIFCFKNYTHKKSILKDEV